MECATARQHRTVFIKVDVGSYTPSGRTQPNLLVDLSIGSDTPSGLRVDISNRQ